LTTSIKPQFTSREIEYAICQKSFIEFLKRIKIMEPPPGRGVIEFEFWPHLHEVARLLTDVGADGKYINTLITILKARQVGISWLLAAYALWTAIFHRGAVVLELSQSEKVAAALLNKCRVINQLLPLHLQPVLGTDSATELSFPSMGAKIMALPSTERAGRSETATLVFQDEADFHEHLETNYTAVKPTVDAGGQLVMASTINKKKANSLFRELYLGAPDNGYKEIFIGWDVVPGRDQAWYDKVKAAVPSTAEMSPELYMEQEYPRTAAEALAPSRALAAYDLDILATMMENAVPAMSSSGPVSIYQKWTPGRKYAAGTDTSHGTGKDHAVTVIMDLHTGIVVADIVTNNMDPDHLAYESVELMAKYKNPLWAIEDNDWGVLTLRKSQELNYPRLFKRNQNHYGWHTGESNRFQIFGETIASLRDGMLITHNKEGIQQFMTTLRNEDKNGRIEAMQGTHDDYPLACGLAWQMRKDAWGSGTDAEVQSFRGKDVAVMV
jgi:hypothetical protein